MLEGKDVDNDPSVAVVSEPLSGSPYVVRDFEDAEKDKIQYSHCNGTRYTNETCFEIHGHPEWFLEQMKQNKGNTNNKRPAQAKIYEDLDLLPSLPLLLVLMGLEFKVQLWNKGLLMLFSRPTSSTRVRLGSKRPRLTTFPPKFDLLK